MDKVEAKRFVIDPLGLANPFLTVFTPAQDQFQPVLRAIKVDVYYVA
jgi:hypothetical protein